jgi:hypothetical protein
VTKSSTPLAKAKADNDLVAKFLKIAGGNGKKVAVAKKQESALKTGINAAIVANKTK